MRYSKNIVTLTIQLLVIAILASCVQALLLNWTSIMLKFDQTIPKDQVYSLSDSEKANWETSGTKLLSLEDPMLVYANINCYVEQIVLSLDAETDIPYIDVFYINQEHPQYGDQVLRIENPEEKITVSIKDYITDLRIDLGDEKGTILNDLSVIINPIEFRFSIAIVVAVLLIYVATRFLFYLQKSPNYGIEVYEYEKDNIREDKY